MTITQRIFAFTAAALFLILVFGLIRQRKVDINYSILWIFISVAILAISIWYDLLLFVSKLIGAVTPTTTLFIFGTIFLLALNIHYSIRMTQMSRQIKILAQESAFLRFELRRTAGQTEQSPAEPDPSGQ